MIRYVVALVLAGTIVGMTVPALDHTARTTSEQSLEAEIDRLETAALSLAEHEAVGPESAGPRRIVDLDLPADGLASDRVETVQFERIGTETTRVTYAVSGGTERSRLLPVPIQHATGGSVDLSNERGTVRIVVSLTIVDGDRVVTMATAS